MRVSFLLLINAIMFASERYFNVPGTQNGTPYVIIQVEGCFFAQVILHLYSDIWGMFPCSRHKKNLLFASIES